LVEGDIAGDNGDGLYVDRGMLQGHHERHRIVGGGVSVDEKSSHQSILWAVIACFGQGTQGSQLGDFGAAIPVGVKPGVDALAGQQLMVAPALHETAMIEDQDFVGGFRG
jgi:hypothetical protein